MNNFSAFDFNPDWSSNQQPPPSGGGGYRGGRGGYRGGRGGGNVDSFGRNMRDGDGPNGDDQRGEAEHLFLNSLLSSGWLNVRGSMP
jgi:hypothetical protein